MLVVKLTDEIKEKANRFDKLALSTHTPGTNYTGVRNPDRFLVGYLGELAFEVVLQERGIKYLYPYPRPEHGATDDGDFFCIHNGKVKSLDVKTASQPTHKMLMIPDATVKKYKRDAYIGARLNGDTCEFFGYLPGPHANSLPVSDRFHPDGTLTRYKELTELTELDTLLGKLERF